MNVFLFRTRSRKTGKQHPSWRARFRDRRGRLVCRTLYTDKVESLRAAERLAQREAEIREGLRAAPKEADRAALVPITEHVAAFLTWGRSAGGRRGRPWATGWADKLETWLTMWTERLGLKTLPDLDLGRLETGLQEMQAAGASGKSLNLYAGALRAFARWCVRRDLLEADPLRGLVSFDATPKVRRRALSLDEIGRILNTAPADHALLYRFTLVTAFRASEIASLRVGDLDPVAGTVRLRGDHAKNRKEVVRPLPRDVAADLATVCEGRREMEAVFPWFVAGHAARTLDVDLVATGIPKTNFHGRVDFHALRVSALNLGLALNFDPRSVQDLARHSSLAMVDLYARSSPERLRDAVNSLGRALSEAKENAPNSRTGVKRASLRMAAGGENQTYPKENTGDAAGKMLVPAGGFEPPT